MKSRPSGSDACPKISIILPTFNRQAFLADAFDSIRAQTFSDWELIVVDDGSTDQTRSVVERLSEGVRRYRYLHQANGGAYAARQLGLNAAEGNWIAFFDSDDLWAQDHLQTCMTMLTENPDVDWVFGGCRIVDQQTGRELLAHTFFEHDTPRQFLSLRHREVGELRIIDDPNAIECALLHGFYCGLQNSVIRRSLLERMPFDTSFRNEAEDRLIVVRALLAGYVFGYVEKVLVTYRVHGANSTAPAAGKDVAKRRRVLDELICGYEKLRREAPLSGKQLRGLDRRLAREYFWHLGYSVLWENGHRQEALQAFRQGLKRWPWNLAYWKTYLVARVKYLFSKSNAA